MDVIYLSAQSLQQQEAEVKKKINLVRWVVSNLEVNDTFHIWIIT